MSKSELIPPSPSAAAHRDNAEGEDPDLFGLEDPFGLFARWFALARDREPRDPHAMTLATVDAQGAPDARTVLLKDFDEAGFVFYTNTESAKGRQLASAPLAALCFYWRSTVRQVRVRGHVSPVSDAEADAYFATRARDSRVGAWASAQSSPLASRSDLEAEIARLETRFAGDEDIPRPPSWSGYRLAPLAIEFWIERPFRLHDRRLFRRPALDAPWDSLRLSP